MNALENKKIILGITGGIAAYKSADLVRRLRELGIQVRVVMTSAAQEFVTPLTFQAVSGNSVSHDLLDPAAEAAMGHIELARWADRVVIAPATADFIAKLAHGYADDLLSTLCLATLAPIAIVPAMNQGMWLNAATQANVASVLTRGIDVLGPAKGAQACGEFGPGRMLESAEVVAEIKRLFAPKLLSGKKILVTAGPTREAIDPVRFISNRSSGKMGYAVAEAASFAGAEVILISGPTQLTTPVGVRCIHVNTAQEMYDLVHQEIDSCDIFIATAAVADYRCEKTADQKIKKDQLKLALNLVRNKDILASVTELAKKPFTVGFAAETENVLEQAKKKLHEKKLDLIVANRVGVENSGFESDLNQFTVLWPKGQKEFPLASKNQLAQDLVVLIAEHYTLRKN